MLLETLRRALTEPNILWLPTPPENRFHSNQIWFYSYLGEVFPLPEFQAKLFLMRNWVGGFYRDSLLTINKSKETNETNDKENVTLRKFKYLAIILAYVQCERKNESL